MPTPKASRKKRESRMPLKTAKGKPYPFVLELLEGLEPVTRPMFGCTAIYVGEKIVLILRERADRPDDPDNGVWIASPHGHHECLLKEFPSMRPITIRGDPRIGKVPKPKRKS